LAGPFGATGGVEEVALAGLFLHAEALPLVDFLLKVPRIDIHASLLIAILGVALAEIFEETLLIGVAAFLDGLVALNEVEGRLGRRLHLTDLYLLGRLHLAQLGRTPLSPIPLIESFTQVPQRAVGEGFVVEVVLGGGVLLAAYLGVSVPRVQILGSFLQVGSLKFLFFQLALLFPIRLLFVNFRFGEDFEVLGDLLLGGDDLGDEAVLLGHVPI